MCCIAKFSSFDLIIWPRLLALQLILSCLNEPKNNMRKWENDYYIWVILDECSIMNMYYVVLSTKLYKNNISCGNKFQEYQMSSQLRYVICTFK